VIHAFAYTWRMLSVTAMLMGFTGRPQSLRAGRGRGILAQLFVRRISSSRFRDRGDARVGLRIHQKPRGCGPREVRIIFLTLIGTGVPEWPRGYGFVQLAQRTPTWLRSPEARRQRVCPTSANLSSLHPRIIWSWFHAKEVLRRSPSPLCSIELQHQRYCLRR